MHDHEHEHVHGHAHGQSHSHPHTHDHPHGEAAAMSFEETLALLGYMLDHNMHHCEELKGISEKLSSEGKAEAAETLLLGTKLFDQANEKLAATLALLKE